ncbi:class C sortase [Enterococcus sp. AZ109]|uniref:class C sortase n=1 Tax=Enterococcus sp. AZ109 TaxID=2774634 RepID=UPI003F682EDF
MANSKKKKEKKPNSLAVMIQRIIMLLVFLFGLSLLLYPFVSQGIVDYLDQRTVQKYQREASEKNEAEIQKLQQEMEARNEKARKENNPGADGEAFSEERRQKEKKAKPTLSYVEEHTAGTIIIPEIDVKLPVYDITNDFFLSKGATILDGTSSLTGGPSTHSVISSHRGLKKAKLFTDLSKLKVKDQFFIEVLNDTHAYEVDQVKVIEPTETKDLLIVDGMDYVTLLTCTPYGINSHRLLVRGHRIPYVESMKKEIEKVDKNKTRNFILLVTGIVLGILGLLYTIHQIIRLGMIGRRKYKLSFYLKDMQNQPLKNITVELLGKRGKNPVILDGEKVVAVSDEEGKVEFPLLYGKVYTLGVMDKKHLRFARTRVKRIKDNSFILKKLIKGSIIDKHEVKIPGDLIK